jgi:hypothetical protein
MSGEQITSLDGMSPKEIARATRQGRLDALLSGDADAVEMAEARAEWREAKAEAEPAPTNPDMGARGGPRQPKYDEAWLATASPAEIARATRAGKLEKLL